jgi:hypothetical protein
MGSLVLSSSRESNAAKVSILLTEKRYFRIL